MSKSSRNCVVAVLLLFLASCTTPLDQEANPATEQAKGVLREGSYYWAPTGIYRFSWGDSLDKFDGFVDREAIFAGVVYSPGKTTRFDLNCQARGQNPCDLEFTLQRGISQTTEGEGFHTLAEYVRLDFRYPVASNIKAANGESLPPVEMWPVFWQQCAQWSGLGDLPNDLSERLQFCGIRAYFETEHAGEIKRKRKHNPDFLSTYERVLLGLKDDYGRPPGYEDCYSVQITTPDERIDDPKWEQRCLHRHWQWCKPRGRELSTSCDASISLFYDETQQLGAVAISTAAVWQWAFGQRLLKQRNDHINRLLYGKTGGPDPRHSCRGSGTPLNECPFGGANVVEMGPSQRSAFSMKMGRGELRAFQIRTSTKSSDDAFHRAAVAAVGRAKLERDKESFLDRVDHDWKFRLHVMSPETRSSIDDLCAMQPGAARDAAYAEAAATRGLTYVPCHWWFSQPNPNGVVTVKEME